MHAGMAGLFSFLGFVCGRVDSSNGAKRVPMSRTWYIIVSQFDRFGFCVAKTGLSMVVHYDYCMFGWDTNDDCHR